MARHSWNGAGKPSGGGTKVCTYCNRVHPKGRRKKAGFKGCHAVAISRQSSDVVEATTVERSAVRKVKCVRCKQRSAERRSLSLTKAQYNRYRQRRERERVSH